MTALEHEAPPLCVGARVQVIPCAAGVAPYEAVVLALELPHLVYLEGYRGAVHPSRVRVLALELGRG